MSEETKKLLQDILTKIPGLHCILITDREGVPVVKVCTEKAPEGAMRFGFISTFGLAVDQGSKLGLGRTSTVICYYSQYQVIQMNKLPLVLTFIAGKTCNTGHIMALENRLESLISELSLVVADT
ncbi:ragulator complex protein LAMTOR3-A [Coccinella septempunctata]|uniref:ragulator complex protein LAMTOR3-A n=1 Tax=Coccinella septempunctata TaxID=41139 RepID=UPI001D07ED47|nr:ragulator complex protein LAMTOR3-A [Coccinella septempunctata]